MQTTEYLSEWSTEILPKAATTVIQELSKESVSWSQLAYNVFQDSGYFTELDRFKEIADILIAEPWNNVSDVENLISTASEFFPVIDSVKSAVINGIDVLEQIEEIESIPEIVSVVVNWGDSIRSIVSNEI